MGSSSTGALGLVAALALGVSDTSLPASLLKLDGPDGAALAALRGDLAGARALLRQERAAGEEAGALVVAASVALEEGRTDEATRIAAKLSLLRPDAAEPKLLMALVAERSAHPRGDWLATSLGALRRLHPLKESAPLLHYLDRMQAEWMEGRGAAPPTAVLERMGAGEAFLVRWLSSEGPRREPPPELLGAAKRLANSDERVLVHLAALDVLEGGALTDPEAAAARAALLAKLRVTQPGAVRLLVFERRPDTQPVTEDEVATIEAALVGEDPTPFAATYAELLELLEKVDPATASNRAMSGAVTLVFTRYFPTGLGSRIGREPKLPEPIRRRLSKALVRLADLQQRQGTILTDMLAAVSLGQASALTSDARLKARAEELKANGESLRATARCVEPLMRLPIASLHRRWAREVPRERETFDEMRRLGLSCPEPPLTDSRERPSADGKSNAETSAAKGNCPD